MWALKWTISFISQNSWLTRRIENIKMLLFSFFKSRSLEPHIFIFLVIPNRNIHYISRRSWIMMMIIIPNSDISYTVSEHHPQVSASDRQSLNRSAEDRNSSSAARRRLSVYSGSACIIGLALHALCRLSRGVNENEVTSQIYVFLFFDKLSLNIVNNF